MRGISIGRPALSAGRLREALTPRPRLRRRMIAAALIAALLTALYFAWLRDSSLVAVEQVTITGLTSTDAERAHSALASAAQGMTTLHVDVAELERAAEPFPAIAGLRVSADFPNALRIEVIEHRPVAILDASGTRVPVAADGTVLGDVETSGSLPTIRAPKVVPEKTLPPGPALDAARVAGAAPASILGRIEAVSRQGGGRGVVARVVGGPEIVFGPATLLSAKWAAAVRVLTDDGSEGAAYLDVRIPERPTAGGLVVETLVTPAPIEGGQVLGEVPAPTASAPSEGYAEPTPATPQPAVEAPAPVAPETPVAPAPAAPPAAGGGAAATPQP